MAPVILYDLPSRGRRSCWSLNPWKTRMALNYKNIDYKTEWLEYPDVAPTLSAAGVPPNDPSSNPVPYSIPTVRLPDGTYIMDSQKIIVELEKLQPEPSLHIDSDVLPRVQELMPQIMGALVGVFMPRTPRVLLADVSATYFEDTRKVRFGMPLSQLEKEKGGAPAWEAAKEPLQKMAALLNQQSGPFFLGNEVSYADFVLVSFLEYAKRTGQDAYDNIVAVDKSFDEIYKASAKWLERDDH
ncbi:uncharacterized protein J3D65DRAFT_220487 [Phyllosticta citribraziliensis]|uniref:GST C-terminal domain-containing protein n=1 Tax=Phyllosticta citribraziliensis TaxID=989973 RepID=A0ABR1M4P7_9PEZI